MGTLVKVGIHHIAVTVRAEPSDANRTLGEPPRCGVALKVLATRVAVNDSALPDLFCACGLKYPPGEIPPFTEAIFTPDAALNRLESDRTPKRKNPPEGGFFGGFRDLQASLEPNVVPAPRVELGTY